MTKKETKTTKATYNGEWSEGSISIPKKGETKIIHYWVKHYSEGSEWGINQGRISKLMLKMDGKVICNYDRGWDIEPTTEEANLALCILLNDYN